MGTDEKIVNILRKVSDFTELMSYIRKEDKKKFMFTCKYVLWGETSGWEVGRFQFIQNGTVENKPGKEAKNVFIKQIQNKIKFKNKTGKFQVKRSHIFVQKNRGRWVNKSWCLLKWSHFTGIKPCYLINNNTFPLHPEHTVRQIFQPLLLLEAAVLQGPVGKINKGEYVSLLVYLSASADWMHPTVRWQGITVRQYRKHLGL